MPTRFSKSDDGSLSLHNMILAGINGSHTFFVSNVVVLPVIQEFCTARFETLLGLLLGYSSDATSGICNGFSNQILLTIINENVRS